MRSAALSGDVQKKDQFGVWRTVLTASGFTLRDRRLFPENPYAGYVRAPYVPGKAGAFRP
jgi:hypothetical protein